MNDKLKAAFDGIHADEQLKARTKAAVLNAPRRRSFSLAKALVPIACALAAVFGIIGAGIYFKPVSVISIDVNPSVELSVNSFGKVISVDGKNEDGIRLAESVSVKHKNYADAVTEILQCSEMFRYTAENEEVSIVVVSLNGGDSDEMLRSLERCAGSGVSCCQADYGAVSKAHECGLSYGKYRAYLEAKEAVPELAPEDVQGLTMREIRELTCGETHGNGGHHGNGYHGGHAGSS